MKHLLGLFLTLAFLNANSISATNDPFEDLDKIFELQKKQIEIMQEEMNKIFDRFKNSSFPTISFNTNSIINYGLQDKKDHYEIVINTSKDTNTNLNIQTKDNLLTIKVEQSKEIKKDNNQSKIESISRSSYMQTLTLPNDADTTKIKSQNKDGKIIITIPKKK